jgi:MFS family permease
MIHRAAAARPRGCRSLFTLVVAWLVVLVYATGIMLTIWLEHRLHVRDDPLLEDALLIAGFGAFAVVGALLVAKRPSNLIGWIMAAVALMVGLGLVGDAYAAYAMTTRGRPDALAVVGAWTQGWSWYLLLSLALIYLPLLFPDGRLPSRRWLPVAVLAGIGTLGMVIPGMLTDTLRGTITGYKIDNPIGIEGLAPVEKLPAFGVLSVLFLGVGVVGAVACLVVRFRRSRGIERQQMKWFVYAAALLLLYLVSILASDFDFLPEIVSGVVLGLALVALPTAIGTAILKHRLYDIDVIINRTLVYGSLTALLVAVYFGGVATTQAIFRALTGQEQQPQLAVVTSTLVLAALFNPLRRRIQSFIDRRFYRRKYNAAKTLEAFSAKLRDETDLEALNNELVGVVRETMQPAHVSLWLRPDTALKKDEAPG